MSVLSNTERKEEGFTLIEMVIVITLIGFVATFAGLQIMNRFNKAKIDSTKIQMRQLGVVLDDFNRECGFYPSTEQGLQALVTKPQMPPECKAYDPKGYISSGKLPKDAWGNEFNFESDGQKYVIISLGADNRAGGEGNNADIRSDALE
ncbi:type II secretion system major pseudopilin GspG [bacterium]|jgi:general secretion pathway protein G|nr:type II secretion system major pseudopilin GspG [bacterium]